MNNICINSTATNMVRSAGLGLKQRSSLTKVKTEMKRDH